MAKSYNLDETVGLLAEKLEDLAEENSGFVTLPIDSMLMGGYALLALGRSYGVELDRKTDDVDLYSLEARTITALSGAITPTGARVDLTDDLHAELFEWVSGMDKEEYFELFQDGFTEGNLVYSSDNINLYRPEPAAFVINKLYSSREPTRMDKDLKDVAVLTSILLDNDPRELAKVEAVVEGFGLTPEYHSAMKFC